MKTKIYDVLVVVRTVVMGDSRKEVKDYLKEGGLAEIVCETETSGCSIEAIPKIQQIRSLEQLPPTWTPEDGPWGKECQFSYGPNRITCKGILSGEDEQVLLEKEHIKLLDEKNKIERKIRDVKREMRE